MTDLVDHVRSEEAQRDAHGAAWTFITARLPVLAFAADDGGRLADLTWLSTDWFRPTSRGIDLISCRKRAGRDCIRALAIVMIVPAYTMTLAISNAFVFSLSKPPCRAIGVSSAGPASRRRKAGWTRRRPRETVSCRNTLRTEAGLARC